MSAVCTDCNVQLHTTFYGLENFTDTLRYVQVFVVWDCSTHPAQEGMVRFISVCADVSPTRKPCSAHHRSRPGMAALTTCQRRTALELKTEQWDTHTHTCNKKLWRQSQLQGGQIRSARSAMTLCVAEQPD
eukprot:749717-Amphidinium_carterae.1